jgi:transposase
MNPPIVHQVVYLGIDVSQDYLDLHCEIPGVPKRMAYTRPLLSKLLKKLRLQGDGRVVCEASGRCEALLVKLCHELGVPIYVVNPERARQYAKSQGLLAKTDAIDARLLCLFVRGTPKLRPTAPLTPHAQQLNALSTRRRQLIALRVAEQNRLPRAEPIARISIRECMRFLSHQIAKIDAQLRATINACPVLRAKVDVLIKVKGVGPTTAMALLAAMPELGSLPRTRASSLAGLAPFPDDSGKRKGQRHIHGGRLSVRTALYMSALVAAHNNPVLKPFYERLRAHGKPAKLALTAVMRKLLLHLNSQLKKPLPLLP